MGIGGGVGESPDGRDISELKGKVKSIEEATDGKLKKLTKVTDGRLKKLTDKVKATDGKVDLLEKNTKDELVRVKANAGSVSGKLKKIADAVKKRVDVSGTNKKIESLDSDLCNYSKHASGEFGKFTKRVIALNGKVEENNKSIGMSIDNLKNVINDSVEDLEDVLKIELTKVSERFDAIEHELSKTPYTKFKERHPILFKELWK